MVAINKTYIKKQRLKEDILSQRLFGNFHIKHNDSAIFIKSFGKSNIKTIRDIWDTTNNTFINITQIFDKLQNRVKGTSI